MSFSTGTKIGSNMGTWLNTNSTSSSSSNGASGSSGSSGSTGSSGSSGGTDFNSQLEELKRVMNEAIIRQVVLRKTSVALSSSKKAAEDRA